MVSTFSTVKTETMLITCRISPRLTLKTLIVILFLLDTVYGKFVSPRIKMKVQLVIPFILHCKPLATLVPLQVNVTLPGQYDPLVSGSDVNVITCAPIFHIYCTVLEY